MMNLDHSNAALFAALALAQSEVENATKGSTNPHFKSKYADLAEVLNTVRPVYSRHGIAIVQSTGFDGVMVSVTTALVHKEGGYVTSVASCTPAKTDGQGVGAATTYLRRYSLAAACGVAQEDDDGQSAAHNRPAVVAKPSNQLLDLLAATQDATDEDVLRNLYKATENLVEHEKGEARKAIVQKRSTITKV
jgi:ERF superfamily